MIPRSIAFIRSSVASGTGVKAPMPPVFGPRSPSSRRLWSRALPMIAQSAPSQIAKTESSGPSSRSWRTSRSPARPSSRRRPMRSIAAMASAAVSQTTTPLPRARPSALTTSRPAVIAHDCDRVVRGRRSGEGPRPRVRHAGDREDVRGPGLARLDPRGGGRRAERRDPGRLERVHDPEGERVVRSDDDEVGPLGRAPGRDGGDVGRLDRHERRQLRDPGVAGSRVELDARSVGRELPADRVLATTPTDDEDPRRPQGRGTRHRFVAGGADLIAQRECRATRVVGEDDAPRRVDEQAAPGRVDARRDGLRGAAALRAHAGDEERHPGAELTGPSQLVRVGRPDDEHAVAVLVPLVADATRDDLPQRLVADTQVLELARARVARPTEDDADAVGAVEERAQGTAPDVGLERHRVEPEPVEERGGIDLVRAARYRRASRRRS